MYVEAGAQIVSLCRMEIPQKGSRNQKMLESSWKHGPLAPKIQNPFFSRTKLTLEGPDAQKMDEPVLASSKRDGAELDGANKVSEEPDKKRARVDEASSNGPQHEAEDAEVSKKGFGGSTSSLGFGGVLGGGGGFAALKSSGFGSGSFATLAQKSSVDGSGFGEVKPSTAEKPVVFGTSKFGETEVNDEAAVETTTSVEKAAAALNGEEDEKCLARYRAKLFVLGKGDELEDNKTADAPASWRERGIGQIRVLESKEHVARLVMRREQTHLVVLNVKLAPKHATVAKHGETALRLVCVTSATAATTYLIKVKQREDRDAIFNLICAKTDSRTDH